MTVPEGSTFGTVLLYHDRSMMVPVSCISVEQYTCWLHKEERIKVFLHKGLWPDTLMAYALIKHANRSIGTTNRTALLKELNRLYPLAFW